MKQDKEQLKFEHIDENTDEAYVYANRHKLSETSNKLLTLLEELKNNKVRAK